jgi:hypothetical protein
MFFLVPTVGQTEAPRQEASQCLNVVVVVVEKSHLELAIRCNNGMRARSRGPYSESTIQRS